MLIKIFMLPAFVFIAASLRRSPCIGKPLCSTGFAAESMQTFKQFKVKNTNGNSGTEL